jgi:DNA-binding IclR family transcriptional regulator
MDSISGVGVLDKTVRLIDLLERGPRSLAELVTESGMSRATAHRLALALETHGLVRRDSDGRFVLGLRMIGLGHSAALAVPGWLDAGPTLAWLRAETNESVQLFVRDDDARVCIESLDGPHELRTIVPVGARLPLDRGSAGKVLTDAGGAATPGTMQGSARMTARANDGHGGHGGHEWIETVAEREQGVASVSAPVRDGSGRVLAAVSVSGPIERTTKHPGARYGDAVVAAAAQIAARLT